MDLQKLEQDVNNIISNKDSKQAKTLIKTLNENLLQWSREYYVLNKPSVDDYTYDIVYKQLEKLLASFPDLVPNNSITLQVGAESSNKFKKVSHFEPMLSLENSYNSQDIDDFIKHILKEVEVEATKENKQTAGQTKQQPNLAFVCEPKIDGLSISCIYENGVLTQAVTRGNGLIGEDVTNNVLMIGDVPKTIPYKYHFEARGEVYLPKSELITLNQNGNNFANTRNTASGALRNLDPEVTKSRNLKTWFYFVPSYVKEEARKRLETENENESRQNSSNETDTNPSLLVSSSHYNNLLFLKQLGFSVALDYIKKATSLKEINDYINWFDTQRNSLNYDTDGAVIKLDDTTLYNQLGATSKFPKWAVAYKYPPTLAKTKLLDILVTVGRTGKINFTAQLEPVNLSGSMITFATLHNASYIKDHDIRIGDTVLLFKAAEVIPKIDRPDLTARPANTKPYLAPIHCPSCNAVLTKLNEDEVDIYCLNEECNEKKLQQLIYFASKPVANIEGLNEKTIQKFFEAGLIKELPDFYRLKDHYNEIITNDVFRIKNKLLDKIILNIEKTKNLPWYVILTGLGIKFVGKETAKLLAKNYSGFKDLMNSNVDNLSAINGIGSAVANSVINWFKDEKHLALLQSLKEAGLKMEQEEKLEKTANKDTTSPYFEKTFVITGSFENMAREEIAGLLETKYNAKVTSAISKSTDYLLVGANPGSKFDKALKLNIKTISLNDVLNEQEDEENSKRKL